MEVLHSFRSIVEAAERLALSPVAWLALLSAIGSIVLTALFIKIATVQGWVVVPSQIAGAIARLHSSAAVLCC